MRFVSLPNAESLDNDSDFLNFIDHLKNLPLGWDGRIAIDTETTGLNLRRDVPVFGSISDGVRRWLLTMEQLMREELHELIADPDRVWVMANAKFDMHMMNNIGAPHFAGDVADIIVMSALRDENRGRFGRQGLKEQSADYLGIDMKPFSKVFNVKEKDSASALLSAPMDVVAGYATLDAYCTWLLSAEHEVYLRAFPLPEYSPWNTLWEYFCELEIPFTTALWRCEERGFQVDAEYLREVREPIAARIEELLVEVNREAGQPIKPGSTKDLTRVFFGKKSEGGMALRPSKFTNSGAPSTDEQVLKKLAAKGVRLAELIVEYRGLVKTKSTYIDGLLEKLTREDRLHCNLLQAGTITGRLSSRNPNLQNIPSSGDVGKLIRSAFIAPEGYRLGVWDYGQIEMRYAAHASCDENMIRAINDGMDLHCFTAAHMLNVDYDMALGAKVMDDAESREGAAAALAAKLDKPLQYADRVVGSLERDASLVKELLKARKAAKAIGFGILYGKGPGALGEELGLTTEEAKEKIKSWFRAFPGVQAYIKHTKKKLENDPEHTLFTLLGRPRRLSQVTSAHRGIRAKAFRDAINAPIQGSAADIVKMAMIRIEADEEIRRLGAVQILQVHDEVLLIAPDNPEVMSCVEKKVIEIMENAVELRVPLHVEGGFADNWASAK